MKRIAIYCASSSKIREHYFRETEKLAILLVQNNYEVVCGGGSVGLMGILADTMLKNGGKITGVIPHFMNNLEWGHTGLTDLVVVNTMHERKHAMLENTDGLIALPGGTGTMEELLEAITLKRLGLYTKPIVVLNTNGFYDPLQEMFKRCISENFMNGRHNDMWRFVKTPAEVIDVLNTMPVWDKNAIDFAVVK